MKMKKLKETSQNLSTDPNKGPDGRTTLSVIIPTPAIYLGISWYSTRMPHSTTHLNIITASIHMLFWMGTSPTVILMLLYKFLLSHFCEWELELFRWPPRSLAPSWNQIDTLDTGRAGGSFSHFKTLRQVVEYWSYFVSDTRVPYLRFQIKSWTKVEDTYTEDTGICFYSNRD